ncbi:UNVERIFIED_CONTAM: Macrophage migration inhibitory factor [Sesamum radiatum]|uniref:L-dopachrome isomerase n=1 Tax=Sesamum radiatum TaxID=300843 RepID=A0AAW2KP50_SESRA
MPTLNLFTNVPVDAVVASDILKDATKAVAKIIGKPESVALTTCPLYTCMIFVRVDYVMILVNGGVPISFGGTEEPAAYGELISIGGLGPSVNAKLSSTIAEILQTKLSIESSRFYIKFYDVQVYYFVPSGRYPSCLAKKRDTKKILAFAPDMNLEYGVGYLLSQAQNFEHIPSFLCLSGTFKFFS